VYGQKNDAQVINLQLEISLFNADDIGLDWSREVIQQFDKRISYVFILFRIRLSCNLP
jgi:hypothetical protein